MLGEHAQRFEIFGRPDYEPFICSPRSDVFAGIRSRNAEYGCRVVLVVRISGSAPISPCADELDGPTADGARRVFRRFSVRRGRGWELPFDEGEVLVDAVCEGSTGCYGGCGQAWCSE